MRTLTFAMSIVALCLGIMTFGGASCLSVLNYEPPHPHWMVSVSDANAHPEHAKVDSLASAEYSAWIFPGDAPCTLEVKDASGKVLGQSKSGMCIVSLTAHAGDAWSFTATSSEPNAEIHLGFDNPLFPRPLNYVALGGALLIALAVLLGALSFALWRRAKRLSFG